MKKFRSVASAVKRVVIAVQAITTLLIVLNDILTKVREILYS